MKPTKILTLVINAAALALLAYLGVRIGVGAGLPIPISEPNLLVTLPAIAVVNIGLAVPILRYKRAAQRFIAGAQKSRPKRLNPFYAVRVVPASIAGTWFFGWHLGVLGNQVSTQVMSEAVVNTVIGLVGSLMMVIAGVIAEKACRLPEDDSTAEAA